MMDFFNMVCDKSRMSMISIFYNLRITISFVVGFNLLFAVLYMFIFNGTSLHTVCDSSANLSTLFCYFFHTSAGTFQAGPPLFINPEVLDKIRESGESVAKIELMLFIQSLVGFLILGAMMTQIMRKVTKS